MIWICDKCGKPENEKCFSRITMSLAILPSEIVHSIQGESKRQICSECFKEIGTGWHNTFFEKKEEVIP